MIILGPKTAILGPQFCRILVLGPHFWWSGGPGTPGPPLDPPLIIQSYSYFPQFIFNARCMVWHLMLIGSGA